MIEIRITKEIGNYDPKFIGPFTLRQTIAVAVAAPACYFIYNSLSPILTPDVAGFFCAIPGGIAAAFGWIQPYGMRMEKFVQSVFINMFVAPSHRKYVTENDHERLVKMGKEQEKAEILAALPKGREGKKARKELCKKSRTKYKRSAEAIQ